MKFQYLVFLAVLGAVAFAPVSQAQHSTGNGGDAYVAEFTRIARKIQLSMVSTQAGKKFGVDADAFLTKINTAGISSTDDLLYLNGVIKDVKNFPDTQTIVISRPRWKTVLEDQKDQIVTHELLGLMGFPDQKYEISSYLFIQSKASVEELGQAVALNPADFTEWTNQVGLGLKEASNNAYQAHTSADEKLILLTAIQNTLDQSTLRNEKYFAATLNASLQDEEEFPDDIKLQIRILRNGINFGLDDIANLAIIASSQNDNTHYVAEVFSRGLDQAALTITRAEEVTLLDSLLLRGINLLVFSDYNRTPRNACAITELTRTRQLALDTNDLILKKQLYQSVLTSVITNGFNCH
jgi:hypothetical protein